MTILKADGIGISFGGAKALDGVSFSVSQGEIVSIIGPNGAGKTTLINVISGIYRADRGHVALAGVDVTRHSPDMLAASGLSRTFQNLQIFQRMTALENVMVGRHLREHRSLFADLIRCPSVTRQNRATRQAALDLLDSVGLRESADVTAGFLSYGACKRLEIARALAAEPRVLLLDEPAAGCNMSETEDIKRLMRMIVGKGITIVLVEHDMKLVMRISDRILVLHHGELLAQGSPAEVRNDRVVVDAYLGKRWTRMHTNA